jgi:hypothetical protein
MDFSAITEAIRRRQGLGASGAGIQGGMPASNAPTAGNPIFSQGQATTPPPQMSGSPFAQDATKEQVSALQQAKPGLASFIVKSLAKHLEKLQNPE